MSGWRSPPVGAALPARAEELGQIASLPEREANERDRLAALETERRDLLTQA